MMASGMAAPFQSSDDAMSAEGTSSAFESASTGAGSMAGSAMKWSVLTVVTEMVWLKISSGDDFPDGFPISKESGSPTANSATNTAAGRKSSPRPGRWQGGARERGALQGRRGRSSAPNRRPGQGWRLTGEAEASPAWFPLTRHGAWRVKVPLPPQGPGIQAGWTSAWPRGWTRRMVCRGRRGHADLKVRMRRTRGRGSRSRTRTRPGVRQSPGRAGNRG